MAKSVYIAGVGLTKVDLTGQVFGSVFDLFAEAYRGALEDSRIRSFGAVQIGIMDSEEFENRANIAAKIADRLGLTGVPAIRSETASSTGAAAFHEAWYKVASGEFESVLVLAGERMKTVTTEVATAIMSKTVDPEERRFGFTMPGLIALVTQAWFRQQGTSGEEVRNVLARLMVRAHALGTDNPLAAFFGKPDINVVVLYPSGRVYRQYLEDVGANSAVETILRELPDVRVVLVRTRGLWGSSFSWAAGREARPVGGSTSRRPCVGPRRRPRRETV